MGDVDWYQRACELAELYGRALANMEISPAGRWDDYDDRDLRQFVEDAASDLCRHKNNSSIWGPDGIRMRANLYQRYLNESHRRAEQLNWGGEGGRGRRRRPRSAQRDREHARLGRQLVPSYSETGSFPPLDGRPVGKVPPAPPEEPKTQEEDEQLDICPRCGKEKCKHNK